MDRHQDPPPHPRPPHLHDDRHRTGTPLPADRPPGRPPQTPHQHWLNGFRVDFFWPDLKVVVETDGLRYHRTPAQQARDHVRDQVHFAAGLRPLRFTRAQVRYEPAHVERILTAVARGKPP